MRKRAKNGKNRNITELIELTEAPAFLEPWMNRFYEEQEIDFLLALAHGEPGDAWESAFLERCHRRGIIDFEGGRMVPADFHARYEIWALFEGWQDIPAGVKDQLNRWELDSYIECNRGEIEAIRSGGIPDREEIRLEYALMHEVIEIIDQVSQVFLFPCNCRSMVNGCEKPKIVCLQFDNPRGVGWEISKSRAVDVLKESYQSGLMQIAELGLTPDGTIVGGICNCCTDCCFPQRLAVELDVETLWPLVRYMAELDAESCISCGECTERCPYEAFTLVGEKCSQDQPAEKQIHFDAALCRGCGLCAGTCSAAAISMRELEPAVPSLVSEVLAD